MGRASTPPNPQRQPADRCNKVPSGPKGRSGTAAHPHGFQYEELRLNPKEKVYEDFLVENLSLIEPGLRLVKRQFHLPNTYGSRGFVDLLCRDSAGNHVVVEIKRSVGTSRDAPAEILQYVTLLRLNHGIVEEDLRCIVVSSAWTYLLVPLSYMARSVKFSLTGLELQLASDGSLLRR